MARTTHIALVTNLLKNEEALPDGHQLTNFDDFSFILFSRTDDGVIDRVFGWDGGEPEDQLLCRNWKWVQGLADEIVALEEGMRIAVRCLNAMPCPTSPQHQCGNLVESTLIAMSEHITLTDYDDAQRIEPTTAIAMNAAVDAGTSYTVASSVPAGGHVLIGGYLFARSEHDGLHHIAELERKGAAIDGRDSWLLHELKQGGVPFIAVNMPDDYARHLVVMAPDRRVEVVK